MMNKKAIPANNSSVYQPHIFPPYLNSPVEDYSELLINILENTSEGFIALDKEWNYIYINEKAVDLLDTNASDLIGKGIWETFPELKDSPLQKNSIKVMVERKPVIISAYYATFGRWFENRIFPSNTGISIFFRDITDQKNADERLPADDDDGKYRLLFYDNPYPIFIVDMETMGFLEVNDNALVKYKYSREEFAAMHLDDIRLPDHDSNSIDAGKKHNPAALEKLTRHKNKDGDIMKVEETLFPVDYTNRKIIRVQVIDRTKDIELTDQLINEEVSIVKENARTTIEAHENERSELGKELHENVNQVLTAAKLYLEHALSSQNGNEVFITKSRNCISDAIHKVNALCQSGFTAIVDDVGILQSINELIENISMVHDKEILFEFNDADEEKIDPKLKLTIYRIVREQLNHIIENAGASEIKVRINHNNNRVKLGISDDGCGFDVKIKRNWEGISNIIKRAELYDGKIKISSAPGKGCYLEVTFAAIKNVKQHSINKGQLILKF